MEREKGKFSLSIMEQETMATAKRQKFHFLLQGGTLVLKCGPKHCKDEVIPFVFSYILTGVHEI